MTKLELTVLDTVYEHLLKEDGLRDWGELDNRLFSLAELDDEQLRREVTMQIAKHREKRPQCILDHNHKAGNCMAVATFAAAAAIHKHSAEYCVFTEAERYILEHYLALAHLEKLN